MGKDIWRFIVAVVLHWKVLVTSSFITAVVVAYVAISKRDLAWSVYMVLFLGVYFFQSCFLAWRDEHSKAEQLDDRRRQQAKADEYAPLLDQGRKIMVKWVAASRRDPRVTGRPAPAEPDVEGVAVQRAAAFDWLAHVRAKLTEDFGPAVGSHFNLGKPTDTNLGLSEPREHEARVLALDRLIDRLRAGTLPLRVQPTRAAASRRPSA
jgi:hypothetical protein